MTPVEFNKIGTQSQLEIFETYFEFKSADTYSTNKRDYADRVLKS